MYTNIISLNTTKFVVQINGAFHILRLVNA